MRQAAYGKKNFPAFLTYGGLHGAIPKWMICKGTSENKMADLGVAL